MNKVNIKIAGETPELKLLQIEGMKSDHLSNHKVNLDAVLVVASGQIQYKDEGMTISLSTGDSKIINHGVVHEVSCITDAMFFVAMPKPTKMKFEKEI